MHKHKAQTILEYTVIIGIIASAFFMMQKYLQRGVQLSIKVAADELGNQKQGVVEEDTFKIMTLPSNETPGSRWSYYITQTNIDNNTMSLAYYRPSNDTTRAQMAEFLTRALGLNPYTEAQIFADVAPDYWAYGGIGALYKAGIVYGLIGLDGKLYYNPDAPLDRAQAAVFLARALRLGTSIYNPDDPQTWVVDFSDVPADIDPKTAGAQPCFGWAQIQAVYAAGIMLGTSSEPPLFKPNDELTREQMAVVLSRAFEVEPLVGPQLFADVPPSHWAYGYINGLYQAGITVSTEGPEGRQRREISEITTTYGGSRYEGVKK